MEGIEYNIYLMQEEYWKQKSINAKLEENYWHLKIQRLKDGDDLK